MYFKRVFLIVLDSVGIGELPDAANFGDVGANTLVHIGDSIENGLNLPNLAQMGLAHLAEIKGITKARTPKAYFTKMKEVSAGKDTMTGHWELMGLRIDTPFNVFPKGFPDKLITELEKRTGRKVIGNIPASGTEILDQLGQEQVNTGAMIVYTSADSVLQIAAHEEVIPLQELYRICQTAREITLSPEYRVGRVIARPFVGEAGNWQRTANRHDYALKPFGKTVMNSLQDGGYAVIALGKINDIFDGEGVTAHISTKSNDDGVAKLLTTMAKDFTGLAFLNLVDFDAVYGHRRNPVGYGQALEQFDQQLPQIIANLTEGDLLMITADHGNDPTMPGTDHTREYVPLLVYSLSLSAMQELPIRETFADVAATIAENFAVEHPQHGKSFLSELK